MLDQNSAIEMMQECLDSLARSGTINHAVKLKPEAELLGPNALLDSIGFVTFVTDLEDRLQAKFNKECYLVLNEIADFNVNSPSLTIDTLARYILKLGND
jgi:hypothetical protein